MADIDNLKIVCDYCDNELKTAMILNQNPDTLDTATIINQKQMTTNQSKEIDKENCSSQQQLTTSKQQHSPNYHSHQQQQQQLEHHQIIHRQKSYIKVFASRTNNTINLVDTEEEEEEEEDDDDDDEEFFTGAADHLSDTDQQNHDLVKAEEFDKKLSESSQTNRMRLAFGLLVSLANGVQNFIRLRGFRGERIWKAAYAYAANTISMGLSSVQVSNRIEPILKIMKLKKSKSIDDKNTSSINNLNINRPKIRVPELIETAEECITLNILAEPSPNTPIRADIILIHGLHGSLVNTWKQGLWSKERNPVDFERPPRPPLRPPKRPRHSRSNIFVPPHKNKKVKLETDKLENDLKNLNCDDDSDFILDPEDKLCLPANPIENLNFPTFRLRFDNYDNSMRSTSPTATPPNSPEPENSPTSSETHNEYRNSSNSYSPCWPGDWLPLDCPGVRVIAINYTTDPYLWRPIWKKKHFRSTMSERVRVMTEKLIEQKVGYGHPIIWVGHSKGGLFIKQIIVDAWESGKQTAAPLFHSSKGVFFYSVPHRGSVLADINLPFIRRSIELIEIEKNSKVLCDLHRRFVGLYHSGHLKVEVFSFVETALTFMQFLYLRIVGVDSADPGIGDVCGLQLDHREICKPRSRNCILYTELVKMINKVC